MRDNAVEGLLSLFTSSDRAEAIAGDLVEEREERGRRWFWLHVARITLTLWRNAATEAPLPVLALAAVGCALLAAPLLGGAAAVRLVPQMSGPPVSWIAVSIIWWGGALWIGASLVAIAPRRGMAACATLALAGEALLIALGAGALRQELQSADSFFFYATALATAAPLMLGGAIARRRMIGCGIPAMEPHR